MKHYEFDELRSSLSYLFPIPLLSYLWPNIDKLNSELTQLVLLKKRQHSGIKTTNIGGWHSKKDFQEWEGECVEFLVSMMLVMGREMLRREMKCIDPELTEGWEVQAWANVNRGGDYNRLHHHIRNSNLWSGVYYVDLNLSGAADGEPARIVFLDQHRVEAKDHSRYKYRHALQPQPGLMLLFPSSLAHRVEPHTGGGERITIAFNLKHPKFTTMAYEMEKNSEGISEDGKKHFY